MKPLALLLIVGGVLGGCAAMQPMVPASLPPILLTDQVRGAAEKEARSQLRDPDSAQFRDFRAFKGSGNEVIVCGMVNGRNGYGGYAGFSPFIAMVMVEPTFAWPRDGAIAESSNAGLLAFYGLFPVCR